LRAANCGWLLAISPKSDKRDGVSVSPKGKRPAKRVSDGSSQLNCAVAPVVSVELLCRPSCGRLNGVDCDWLIAANVSVPCGSGRSETSPASVVWDAP
jgi:hypothetical protein